MKRLSVFAFESKQGILIYSGIEVHMNYHQHYNVIIILHR